MNIYLAAELTGKAKFQTTYQALVKKIKDSNHKVNADHVLGADATPLEKWSEDDVATYYKKVLEGIKHADAVFAEATNDTSSVGYLIAMAMSAGKPVVVFYSGTEEPLLFRTLEKTSDKFQLIRYNNVADLGDEVTFALDFISGAQDTRFNFFISPDLSSYLDWISKTKKIPRSVYLRNLIDADVNRHPDFQ